MELLMKFITLALFFVVPAAGTTVDISLTGGVITPPGGSLYQEMYYTFTFTGNVDHVPTHVLPTNFARNYDIVAFYSDINASAPMAAFTRYSPLSFLAKQITLTDDCFPIHGFASGDPAISIAGTFTIKLSESDCSSAGFLCIGVEPYQGSYTEVVTNRPNNYKCITRGALCSDCVGCHPDMNVLSFALPGFNGPLYTRSFQTLPFSVTLQNIGNVSLNDNLQKNFEFFAGFYDNDIKTIPSATLLSGLSSSSTGKFSFAQTCVEARAMVRLDISSVTFTGSVSVALPEASCTAALYLCFKIAPYNFAYHDQQGSNDYACASIQNVKAPNCKPCCVPDVTIDPTTTLTTDPLLYATFPHRYTFKLVIKNVGLGVISQNFSNNFDIIAQFYDNDPKTNNLAAELMTPYSFSAGTVFLDKPCDAKSSLNNVSAQTLTLGGNFIGSFDAVTCSKIKYVCFTVNPFDNAYEDYIDPNNLLNNIRCFSIAGMISHTCEDRPSQDVDLNQLYVSVPGKYIYVDMEQSFNFRMDLQTPGARTVTVDLGQGFVYSAFYSTGDIRTSQSYEMIGCGAGQDRAFQVTTSGTYALQQTRANTVTATGIAKLRLPNLLCSSTSYLCVSMIPNGLTYTETNYTNNAYCLDVTELLRCGKRYHPNERGCRTNDDCVEFASCDSGYCKCQDGFASSGDGTVCLRAVGEVCFDNYDCITNSICSDDKRCTCKTGFTASTDESKCGMDLGASCKYDADCRTRWGVCDTTTHLCVCTPGFTKDSKGTCVRKKLFLPCIDNSDCGILGSVCDPLTKKCNCSSATVQDAQTCKAKVGGECGTSLDCYYALSVCQQNPNRTSTIRAVCMCADQYGPSDKLRQCVFGVASSKRAFLHTLVMTILLVFLLK